MAGAIALAGVALVPLQSRHAAADTDRGPHTLRASTFVGAAPQGASGPDDITLLSAAGLDHGRPVIWTAFQNGLPPDGTDGSATSTVAGYDADTGTIVKTIAVTGKVDGLRADTAHHRLIATVNEDSDSSLNVINVATGSVTNFTYSPDPASTNGNGGTDSIAFWHGQMFIAHSNPDALTAAAVYHATLDWTTHHANLSALFSDDSTATDAVTGASSALMLTDPDTDAVVPAVAPRFGGQLVLISQGDGQMIFASRDTDPSLTVLNLNDGTGSPPPLDGFAVATADSGTLYVVDHSDPAHAITALHTDGWGAGTVFVSEPNDNNNPLIGTLNLHTGVVSPLGNAFVNPKEVLFVPASEDEQ
ncbi:MAG: hypothetical protein ACREN2_10770 [Candidatus Dormibacteria bacterium]